MPKTCDGSKSKFTDRELVSKLGQEIQRRNDRQNIFAELELRNPVWEILAALGKAEFSGQQICATALCTYSDAPQTTVLRYVRQLVDKGVVERRTDPDDNRRAVLTLSREGKSRLIQYLEK